MPICTDYTTPAINAGHEGPCDYGFGPDYDLQNAINTVQNPGLSGVSELYQAFSEQVNYGHDVEVPSFMDWYYTTGNTMPAYGDWRRRQNMASRLGTKKLYEERIKGMEEFSPIQSGFESDYFGGRENLLDEMEQATSGIISETRGEVFDIGGEYIDILNTTFGQYDLAESDVGAWGDLSQEDQFAFLDEEIENFQSMDPNYFDEGVYDAYQQCLEDNLQSDVDCAELALGGI